MMSESDGRRRSKRIARLELECKKEAEECSATAVAQPENTRRSRDPPKKKKQRRNPSNKKPTANLVSSSAVIPLLKGNINRTSSSSLWKLVEEKQEDDNDTTPAVALVKIKFSNVTSSAVQLPKELQKFLPQMIEFYLFVLERQQMQQGKQTNNQIFQKYHWCNNYRELDRGTAYFHSQILDLKDDLLANDTLTRPNYILEVLLLPSLQ